MTQPISEEMDALEARINKAMGVDDRQPGLCEIHGDFVNVHFSGNGKRSEGWAGCPECAIIRHDEKAEQERKERELERYRQRIEALVRNSGIPERFASKSFDNFQAVNQKAAGHLKKIREYADLISEDDHGGRCLLMLGKVGNGKTHLGCALIEYVIRKSGNPCYYRTFSDLVRQVKGSFAKGAQYSEQDVYEDFGKGRVVVLDEVGMQNFTDFEQAVAYEAINARYLAQRPTVLISNLQASDLPLCVGERVVDRLREGGGRALDFDWKSYRLGGAQ
ncbi:ATP-binding protein [Marinobacter salarius]|uniref:ATP-binding protein n=1 Tax=Marinobacter salarius TaxID=1420917 RepID=UPI0024203DAA|nr:ATP-binding protein [Marinobacter salarius]